MPNEDGNFTPEEVESLKAQLREELQTRDQTIQELRERTSSQEQEISTLQSSRAGQDEALRKALDQARADLETERESLRTDLSTATGKYRSLLLSANPGIPGDLIRGEDIESLEKAKGVVEQVRASVQAQAQAASIPAGAPPRTGQETEALSPTEKIKYALRR